MNPESVEKAVTSTIEPRPSISLVRRRSITPENYDCMIGVSAHVASLREFIVAHCSEVHPILLIGERGMRQEQVARALHEAGQSWDQPFISVNAHSLSGDALHKLLFGTQGAIETLSRGTIYVNELTGLPILLQQRFAAYLEEQRWQGRHGKYGNQRLIFATQFHPEDRSTENRLAYGLVELLKSSSFLLKPLRERGEDIPYIARHLVERVAKKLEKGACEITQDAIKLLMEYAWERNFEELEAVLESAIQALPPRQIDASLLPSRIRHARLRSIPAGGINLPDVVDEYERNLIDTALKQSGGSQTKASRLLGLRVQTLNMKLKRYGDDEHRPRAHGH